MTEEGLSPRDLISRVSKFFKPRENGTQALQLAKDQRLKNFDTPNGIGFKLRSQVSRIATREDEAKAFKWDNIYSKYRASRAIVTDVRQLLAEALTKDYESEIPIFDRYRIPSTELETTGMVGNGGNFVGSQVHAVEKEQGMHTMRNVGINRKNGLPQDDILVQTMVQMCREIGDSSTPFFPSRTAILNSIGRPNDKPDEPITIETPARDTPWLKMVYRFHELSESPWPSSIGLKIFPPTGKIAPVQK